MKGIQGIGGIFFKAQDPATLQAWYQKNLGIGPLPHSPWGGDDKAPLLEWRDVDDPDRKCYTVFSVFNDDTDYFQPSTRPFMLNFRVDDLDAVLAQLKAEGVALQGDIQTFGYGRFAKILDPEGNPIELWEPAEGF